MVSEDNILRRHDQASIDLVENGFREGPLADAIRTAPTLATRTGLTKAEFDREYRAQLRPVVLKGFVSHWTSVQTWSFEHLLALAGDAEVTMDSVRGTPTRRVTFAEFVNLMKVNEVPPAEPLHLQEWYYQTNAPQLVPELPELEIAQYDFRRNLYGDKASVNHQLWVGQQGGITRMHQDSYSVDVMHAQIVGTKRWHVMGPHARLTRDANGEPDWAALVADPHTELHIFDLEPGDVLYLPANWYHRIELLTDSIGLGRKCLDEKNLQMHVRQRMNELLALLLNYDEVAQTHPELVPILMLRSRALAKQMDLDLSRLRP
ncbi:MULTISPECIES: cupin-like domain-containing protein [unclassified Nocardia]|uniref:cupin-like domain-containing protein n=1 Tax=unclassified Nocardia TaxID=2637762 RepID=UPI001CE3E883|nr:MULTISPECIES: cupin-like domain-containing protein [unclassified Nocardia]